MKLQIFTTSIQGSLFCFQFDTEKGVIERIFNTRDHIGRIKSISINGNSLATAGQDEMIKIYDIKNVKQLSNIFGVSGISNKIISSQKYFISAHSSGIVYIIGKDYSIYHKLKVFKNKCVDIDIHPSGVFLICLSDQNRISFWNLSMCAMIFHKKIKVSIEQVLFLNDQHVLFILRNSILIFDLKSQDLINEVELSKTEKINYAKVFQYKNKNILILSLENGFVRFMKEDHLLTKDGFFFQIKIYEKRVKQSQVVDKYLITINTEGVISIFDIEDLLDKELHFVICKLNLD